MNVQWLEYKRGAEVPHSPSGSYWVYLEGRVEIGTREHAGSLTWIWRTSHGVEDLVTHYALMEWPAPPTQLKLFAIGEGQ